MPLELTQPTARHPDERALWRAIEADRCDEARRLIYADWLDDHGRDLEAAWLRSDVELASLPVGTGADNPVVIRCVGLLGHRPPGVMRLHEERGQSRPEWVGLPL